MLNQSLQSNGREALRDADYISLWAGRKALAGAAKQTIKRGEYQMAESMCQVCGSRAAAYVDHHKNSIFRVCPVCGRYEITLCGHQILKDPRLASYLFYNRFEENGYLENRYHTTLDKETCDAYRKEAENGRIL